MQMPAFHVDNDDKDNVGHPRQHSDHPLPRPSLTSFAACAPPEPLPAHFGWRPSPWPTIVSDHGSACKIDARTVLNVSVMAPLTSTSFPALPRFDTNVRASTSNVLERTQRPSRYPPSSPITPPPSLPSMAIFLTTLPTLPTSLNSTPSTPSIAHSPPCYRAHQTSVTLASPLDDVADTFDVALLAALDAAIALHVAALIERRRLRRARRTARRRRRESTSATASQNVVDELGERLPSSGLPLSWAMPAEYWLYRPLTSRLNASCSRAEGIQTSTSPFAPASSKGKERR
ncbi:hypothetical protein EV714DRAFT_278245 [Schizophyllum commune]